MKYAVSNRFETFGDPCTEYHNSFGAADIAARQFAELIADGVYTRVGDDAVIPYYSQHEHLGNSEDVEFHASLSNDSGAHEDDNGEPISGRMPWKELVERIYDGAIEIIEED